MFMYLFVLIKNKILSSFYFVIYYLKELFLHLSVLIMDKFRIIFVEFGFLYGMYFFLYTLYYKYVLMFFYIIGKLVVECFFGLLRSIFYIFLVFYVNLMICLISVYIFLSLYLKKLKSVKFMYFNGILKKVNLAVSGFLGSFIVRYKWGIMCEERKGSFITFKGLLSCVYMCFWYGLWCLLSEFSLTRWVTHFMAPSLDRFLSYLEFRYNILIDYTLYYNGGDKFNSAISFPNYLREDPKSRRFLFYDWAKLGFEAESLKKFLSYYCGSDWLLWAEGFVREPRLEDNLIGAISKEDSSNFMKGWVRLANQREGVASLYVRGDVALRNEIKEGDNLLKMHGGDLKKIKKSLEQEVAIDNFIIAMNKIYGPRDAAGSQMATRGLPRSFSRPVQYSKQGHKAKLLNDPLAYYVKELVNLGHEYKSIYILDGDIGFEREYCGFSDMLDYNEQSDMLNIRRNRDIREVGENLVSDKLIEFFGESYNMDSVAKRDLYYMLEYYIKGRSNTLSKLSGKGFEGSMSNLEGLATEVKDYIIGVGDRPEFDYMQGRRFLDNKKDIDKFFIKEYERFYNYADFVLSPPKSYLNWIDKDADKLYICRMDDILMFGEDVVEEFFREVGEVRPRDGGNLEDFFIANFAYHLEKEAALELYLSYATFPEFTKVLRKLDSERIIQITRKILSHKYLMRSTWAHRDGNHEASRFFMEASLRLRSTKKRSSRLKSLMDARGISMEPECPSFPWFNRERKLKLIEKYMTPDSNNGRVRESWPMYMAKKLFHVVSLRKRTDLTHSRASSFPRYPKKYFGTFDYRNYYADLLGDEGVNRSSLDDLSWSEYIKMHMDNMEEFVNLRIQDVDPFKLRVKDEFNYDMMQIRRGVLYSASDVRKIDYFFYKGYSGKVIKWDKGIPLGIEGIEFLGDVGLAEVETNWWDDLIVLGFHGIQPGMFSVIGLYDHFIGDKLYLPDLFLGLNAMDTSILCWWFINSIVWCLFLCYLFDSCKEYFVNNWFIFIFFYFCFFFFIVIENEFIYYVFVGHDYLNYFPHIWWDFLYDDNSWIYENPNGYHHGTRGYDTRSYIFSRKNHINSLCSRYAVF